MTGDFIEGSTAIGILIIIYSLAKNSDAHYSFSSRVVQQRAKDVDVIVKLPGCYYGISIFAVDENGLPFPRAATTPKFVWINGNKHALLLKR